MANENTAAVPSVDDILSGKTAQQAPQAQPAARPTVTVAPAAAPAKAAQPTLASKARTQVTTTTDVRIELDADALLGVLKTAFDLPDNAKLHVRVPGGGDWSNTDLSIGNGDEGVPLILTFTKREVRESNG